jgi:transcription elongation factor Elf1
MSYDYFICPKCNNQVIDQFGLSKKNLSSDIKFIITCNSCKYKFSAIDIKKIMLVGEQEC